MSRFAKSKQLIKQLFFVFLCILLMNLFFNTELPNSNPKTNNKKITKPKPATKKRKIDLELNNERMKFIEKVCLEGYWQTLEIENGRGKLWITNSFLLLSEKEMNLLLEVAFAYVMDELRTDIFTTPFVLKIDNGTLLGKTIARYEPVKGIKFYK